MNVTAQICRKYHPEQTQGEWTFCDDNGSILFECVSGELKWADNKKGLSCIKETQPGKPYKVIPWVSPSKGKCFKVLDVEGRGDILIHKANYLGSDNPKTKKSDLLGCIAPGYKFGDITDDGIPEILDSKKAFDKMCELFPEGFSLHITS